MPLERFAGFSFDRVLEANIVSLALGRPPKVAVLADAPYIFDGEHWQQSELPEAYRASAQQTESVEIFFGRDNEPRLMGTRTAPDTSPRAVYLRHRRTGWRPEPGELGPLSRSKTGLYGILGFADPELVCSPKAVCLVKRVTGWVQIPADSSPVAMFLTPFGVYKKEQDKLLVLKGKDWEESAALGFEPTSMCHETEARLWASAKAEARLYLRDTARGPDFQPVDTPLSGPRALYCAGEAAVWTVGDGGAAYFDGEVWRKVQGEFGALRVVTGRAREEIWFGGEDGLFLGRPRSLAPD